LCALLVVLIARGVRLRAMLALDAFKSAINLGLKVKRQAIVLVHERIATLGGVLERVGGINPENISGFVKRYLPTTKHRLALLGRFRCHPRAVRVRQRLLVRLRCRSQERPSGRHKELRQDLPYRHFNPHLSLSRFMHCLHHDQEREYALRFIRWNVIFSLPSTDTCNQGHM
jgi:hypothetical protein